MFIVRVCDKCSSLLLKPQLCFEVAQTLTRFAAGDRHRATRGKEDYRGENSSPAGQSPQCSQSFVIYTANGTTVANKMRSGKLPALGEDVKAYALNDTPAVLSLGARCMRKGFWVLLAPLRTSMFGL